MKTIEQPNDHKPVLNLASSLQATLHLSVISVFSVAKGFFQNE
jgi:hypothetical protein